MNFMRIFMMACLATALLAAPASAQYLWGKKDPPPEKTLQAPFNDSQPRKDNEESVIPYQGNKPLKDTRNLAESHRPEGVVAKWLQDVVTTALMFDADAYEPHLEKLRDSFDRYAMQDYEAFLQQQHILQTLRERYYKVSAFAMSPVLVNDGTLEGRYRWLFKVPVTMSFVPKDAQSYENVEPVNRDYTIKIQVGRSENNDDEGLVVESWQAVSP